MGEVDCFGSSRNLASRRQNRRLSKVTLSISNKKGYAELICRSVQEPVLNLII
jgi:hypothetical protein